jgi:predicted nuclease of predicted toxin-antitoxin system
MRFLLNMNVPRELGRRLIAEGHKCRHVGDIGMAHSSDEEIIVEAKANKEIIVTHDLDYGHLLAFSGEPTPSVIIFRLRNTNVNNLFVRLVNSWPQAEKTLIEGAIVVLEDASVRIRSLPIQQKV